MALLDNQTQAQYYGNSDNFGKYQFTSLQDVINQFIIAYVGEGKVITKAKRPEVAFHAQRALQELSFDTLKSIKSHEIEIPNVLQMVLPQDYVNYVRIARVDAAGVLHTILPLNGLSGNPTEMPLQDNKGIPTQDAFGENQEGTSIVEDRWKRATTNEITGNYDAYEPTGVYDFTWWKQVYGQRYGLNPEVSNENGWFSINQRLGTLSFSSNFKGLCVLVNYISDGLGDDMNPVIPKLAEDAIYANRDAKAFRAYANRAFGVLNSEFLRGSRYIDRNCFFQKFYICYLLLQTLLHLL
jgi:hypothetical protein